MQRILSWFFNGRAEMPAYYTEQDYSPANLRLHSSDIPGKACRVDIRDDGVSILERYAELSRGQSLEELAGSFTGKVIEEGSMVTCHLIDTGGGGSLNIQLEMESLN